MISRLINWITNPFKKEEKITLPNVAPLSSEVKNKLIADLIEVAKEFKEKKEVELDTLPLTRVSNEVKEKSKITCLQKYGVEYSCQSDEFKKKCKETCLQKYGVEHPHHALNGSTRQGEKQSDGGREAQQRETPRPRRSHRARTHGHG